jgi:glutathione S-transferase
VRILEHVVRSTFRFGSPDREQLKSKVPELLRYAAVLNGHLPDRTYAACGRDPWPVQRAAVAAAG